MGLGSEAAIESSDMVLSSGNLTQLPKAVKIARSVMRTIKGNILFALAVKALVIILACLGNADDILAEAEARAKEILAEAVAKANALKTEETAVQKQKSGKKKRR